MTAERQLIRRRETFTSSLSHILCPCLFMLSQDGNWNLNTCCASGNRYGKRSYFIGTAALKAQHVWGRGFGVGVCVCVGGRPSGASARLTVEELVYMLSWPVQNGAPSFIAHPRENQSEETAKIVAMTWALGFPSSVPILSLVSDDIDWILSRGKACFCHLNKASHSAYPEVNSGVHQQGKGAITVFCSCASEPLRPSIKTGCPVGMLFN